MSFRTASTRPTHTPGTLFFAYPAQPESVRIKQDNDLVSHGNSIRILSWGKAKANIAVTVAWLVPVPVSGPAIPAVVDPRAAAQHTLIASF